MLTGYSPKLPLTIDANDGFCKLNKTIAEVMKQNVMMIVMTVPGERIMDPDFGVGARNFLFSQEQIAFQNLKSKIFEQVSKYLPMVQIQQISLVNDVPIGEIADSHQIGINIVYDVPSLGITENMDIITST